MNVRFPYRAQLGGGDRLLITAVPLLLTYNKGFCKIKHARVTIDRDDHSTSGGNATQTDLFYY